MDLRYILNTCSEMIELKVHYANSGSVADYANIPYNVITYNTINSVGKQWIRKYFLLFVKNFLDYQTKVSITSDSWWRCYYGWSGITK